MLARGTFEALAVLAVVAVLCRCSVAAPAGVAAAATTTTTTLQPLRDTVLCENMMGNTSSGAGDTLLAGATGQPMGLEGILRRSLIMFDLSPLLAHKAATPAMQITNATLVLTLLRTPTEDARNISLHTVSQTWGAAGSVGGGGSCAEAQRHDATWIYTDFPESRWTAPGGDFSETPSAQTAVRGEGIYGFSGSGMVADLERWLAAPETNFGWLLRGKETGTRTVAMFASMDYFDAANHPSLVVTHS